MATRIRLKRIGKRHQPSYRIVVVDARRARDSKVLDDLGYYNPLKKDLQLDRGRALEWLLRGAQPTDTARWLLSQEGVMAELHRLKFERKRKAEEQKPTEEVEIEKEKEEAQKPEGAKAEAEAETETETETEAGAGEKGAELEPEPRPGSSPSEPELGAGEEGREPSQQREQDGAQAAP